MKSKSAFLVLFASILVSVSALAAGHEYDCKETAASKEKGAWDRGDVELRIDGGLLQLVTTAEGTGRRCVERASLDRSYKGKTVRFESDIRCISSDGPSGIFVDPALLSGKPGRVSITTSQPSDEEGGRPYIYFTNASFGCRPSR